MQKVLGKVRRADEKFKLISDGDKIAVGVSGGKDSMLLALALKKYSIYFNKKFSVKAFTLDMTDGQTDFSEMKDFFEKNEIEFEIIKTDIFHIIFDERKEKNPCSLCAKLRRGKLCNAIIAQGFNKLALGHHADDLVETFFLSLFYEGRLSTFMPKTHLSKTNVTQIRPLIFMEEKDIIGAVRRLNIPVIHNCCGANKNTQREFAKQMIKNLEKEIPHLKTNLFNAITSPERYNLFDKAYII